MFAVFKSFLLESNEVEDWDENADDDNVAMATVISTFTFSFKGAYPFSTGYLSETIGHLSDFNGVPIANLSKKHRVPILVKA